MPVGRTRCFSQISAYLSHMYKKHGLFSRPIGMSTPKCLNLPEAPGTLNREEKNTFYSYQFKPNFWWYCTELQSLRTGNTDQRNGFRYFIAKVKIFNLEKKFLNI